jgi:transcriptional antiterminator RfaH
MSLHWDVVHTRAGAHARAGLNLRRQGFVTYVPRYLRAGRHARRVDTVARRLFPRYLFVAMDVARDRWRTLQSTFCVSNLVVIGNDPVPLPDGVVDEFRVRDGEQGFVRLGLPAGLEPGSPVRLLDSALAECRGIFERLADDRRVTALLEVLGCEVRVLVPAAGLAAA